MAGANSIDQFINERLRQEGIIPNGRTDNERLLRRVFLDLTGLPPKPWEMDRWLEDPSDAQYTLLVDSLLGTSASAERLTMEWLDLARYADSHGMHADGARTSYPYRDWVIDAYAKNMPFDQFVREQVAGDLIENASQDQRIASAFNRMHPQTAEGGVISEEMRLTYVFDRVNTIATGMLGLTMDCSRCHDHKFDPLSQAEYYGFSAFFNNFNELGMTGDDGDSGRTSYTQGKISIDNYGREHHPRSFTMWMAGGGTKPGLVYGKTDDFGYNIVKNPVHVHDLQATLLHLLGVDHEAFTYKFQGRRFRLTDVHGHVKHDLIA